MGQQETEQQEKDIRVHQFYHNIITGTRCGECDRGYQGIRPLKLGEMLEHVERTGHSFYFQIKSVYSLECQDPGRMETAETPNPRLDEFLDINPVYEVVQTKPGETQQATYEQTLRSQLEQQGFETTGSGDQYLQEKYEIRRVWQCNDAVSHLVELDERTESGQCPVCNSALLLPKERARGKRGRPAAVPPHP